MKATTGIDTHSFFKFHGLQEENKFTSADIGSYHAGYTGIAAGVSTSLQFVLAGFGEIVKPANISTLPRRLTELQYTIPPYGDQKVDYHWNLRGMIHGMRPELGW